MGEETQTTEVGPKSVDLTLFRTAQREVGVPVSPDALKKAFNDNVKASIGEDGKVDESLFNTVDEYIEVMSEPYAVKFYDAKEVFNGLTEENFETIDKYILDKIKASNQRRTFDVYGKILKALEAALGVSEDHETMHRIVTVAKFIKHGKE